MNKVAIGRVFLETFEATMKEKNFMRKDKVFHRIVNGKIVQRLSYYKFIGPEVTIQFSLWPLCAGYEYFNIMAGDRLCVVFKDAPSCMYEQAEDYIKYMPKALEITKEKLFPVFDSAVDYDSFLKSNKNISALHPTSPAIYMLGLLHGNYLECQNFKNTWIKRCIEVNRANWGTDYHISPKKQEEFDQECKDYYRMKEAMEKNDRKTIEGYIHSQEQKSLNSYIKAFFSQKKYEKYQETGILPFESVNICPTT